MISPGAAEVSYGGREAAGTTGDAATADVQAVLGEALAVPETDVRLFGRPDETDARRQARGGAGHRARRGRRAGPGPPGLRRTAQAVVAGAGRS